MLPNPLFSAILRVRHLPEEGGLRAATLEQFSGNIGAALAAALPRPEVRREGRW